MKKWFFIIIGIAVVFHFGWLGLREYICKTKGVPKSHFVGYLIYGDKYLSNRGGRPSDKKAKAAKEKSKKAAEKAEKPQEPKAPTSVKKEYEEKMQKAKTERDKYIARVTYYGDMYAVEKDPVKKKAWETKLVELKAKEYAKTNSEIQYKGQLAKYEEVKRKIANYRKNNVRPPAKLLKMERKKPDKEKIYKSLYQKEKARMEGELGSRL